MRRTLKLRRDHRARSSREAFSVERTPPSGEHQHTASIGVDRHLHAENEQQNAADRSVGKSARQDGGRRSQ